MSLTIIPRTAWNPHPRGGQVERRDPSSIREVFIHWPGGNPRSWRHLNTVAEERAAIRGIQQFHIDGNGWSDIGYNNVLVPNWGRRTVPHVYVARGAQYTPAAQALHNTGTLALLVLMGPDDPLPVVVERRIRSYVKWAQEYAGRRLLVRAHGAVTSTDCPGPLLRAAIPRIARGL